MSGRIQTNPPTSLRARLDEARLRGRAARLNVLDQALKEMLADCPPSDRLSRLVARLMAGGPARPAH